ncbi:polysaccharide deacetylase (plasmid) [Rhizobium sp. ACO-34A]|nr:polysaccharide deacetylase family protein [Rhizobium sp. ACO-34A]ATN37575.1 polysaccharide deacetylase [Rhizobium sp. ACO-34A]
MTKARLLDALNKAATAGERVQLWLRDDDAVEPTPALDRLFALTTAHAVPVTLAVIPENTGTPLSERLADEPHALVAVHGWSHRNYAPAGEKKQELGCHRPAETVLGELQAGFDKLVALHGSRFRPILVPPWNRISDDLLPSLSSIGFTSLSVFGKERSSSPIPLVNTHVDVMDWHGTRGGRPADVLFGELADWIVRDDRPPVIGVLTHHLVHDEAVRSFLEELFEATSRHPGCVWIDPAAVG